MCWRMNVSLLALIWLAQTAGAETLIALSTDNVATTYTYPGDISPGVLSLSDDDLAVIAELDDGTDLTFEGLEVSLDLLFSEELGDPGDEFADGAFGAGLLTVVDPSPEADGTTLFEALVTGFRLTEVVAGGFIGSGAFTGAIYGGPLALLDAPLSGELHTDLFTWRTGGFGGPIVDISNFETAPPGGETIYSTMHDLVVVPEPSGLVLSLVLVGMVGGQRRRRRLS